MALAHARAEPTGDRACRRSWAVAGERAGRVPRSQREHGRSVEITKRRATTIHRRPLAEAEQELVPMKDENRLAELELLWYFADACAAIGFHASGFEGSGATAAYDGERAARDHAKRHSPRHRHAAEELSRIGPLVDALSSEDREVARLALTPHAWPPELRAVMMLRRGICVAALAAVTDAAARLRATHRATHPPKPGTVESMADFLAYEASTAAKSKRRPTRLLLVRDEAEAALDRALSAYEAMRQEREEAAKAQRRAYVEAYTAGLVSAGLVAA
jgi:hypothetical protein